MRMERKIAKIGYTEIVGSGAVTGEMVVEYKSRFTAQSAETALKKAGKIARVDSWETGSEVYDVPAEIAAQYKI